MDARILRIHPRDSVAVAPSGLAAGEMVPLPDTGESAPAVLRVLDAIPPGHKLALRPIAEGAPVIKYGEVIGAATQPIAAGAHVHTHNLRTRLSGAQDYRYAPAQASLPALPPDTFAGYARPDGTVGIRNDLWIIPTVGCVNGIATALAAQMNARLPQGGMRCIAFSHPYGCSQMGEDQDATRAILGGLARHPNAGGVLLLGLGCENSGVDSILPYTAGMDAQRLRTLVCQDVPDEMEAGLALLDALRAYADGFGRAPVSAARLVVGLKCGGSDGLSGITANPVIGGFSDRLIARGGATLLTEVPEMFGAEQGLMDRCESQAVFDRAVRMINGFKHYYEENRQPVYENPSPGNKAGGITTLEEKSLGCTQKSGGAPVRDVLDYGARATRAGLSLLSAPGNDLVAATALAAAGAQLVLFSTGRGTPFACPVPTVKISSNTPLARHKPAWIDFDAGRAVSGGLSIAALSDELYAHVLRVAGGEQARHERAGIFDMAIFKRGVTL